MDYTRNEDYYGRFRTQCGANFNCVLDVMFVEGSSEPTEPVSVADAELQAYIDAIGGQTDLIQAFITTARMQCEEYACISMINREMKVIINNTLGGLYLPYGPYQDVTAAVDKSGNAIDLSTLQIRGDKWKWLDFPKYDYIELTYSAGYPNGLPQVLKTAILQQVAYLFEHRGEEMTKTFRGSGNYSFQFSPIAQSLLNQFRR